MREDLRRVGIEVLDEPPSAYEARVNRELPAMRALVSRAGMSAD
jgi:hypothetical protein